MHKKWVLLFILFSLLSRSMAQPANSTFTLQGTINARDSGKMILMTVNTEDYYPSYHGTKQAFIIHGQFSITDSAPYPECYMLGLKYDSGWEYLSIFFFVDPGINPIHCDSSKMWETPAITNQPADESR